MWGIENLKIWEFKNLGIWELGDLKIREWETCWYGDELI